MIIFELKEQHDMDASTQLKTNLINRIIQSNDLDFLNALQNLLDSSEKELYALSADQIAAIARGSDEIENGQLQESTELLAELGKWLKEK